MKYFIIQNIHKNKYIIKIIINIILITLHNQCYSSTNIQKNYTTNIFIPDKENEKKTDNTEIKIQSNQSKLNLSNQEAYFSGNVIITHNNKMLYADRVHLYKTKKQNNHTTSNILLSGLGNIYYIDNTFQLTGNKILTNIQNKDIDLYQNTFYFKSNKIHGTSCCIKQRQNNRFTILKKAHFTTCPKHKQYWKIQGSQLLYDYQKDTLDIWNTHLILKKIPILYIPYLQIPLLTNEKNIKYYYPIPQYNSNNKIEIKLPYYFNLHKHWNGKTVTSFIHKEGIQLQNYIQHSNNLNKELINFNILNNQKLKKNKNYWLLHWKNNNFIHKKWYIKGYYTIINDLHYLHNNELKYIHTNNNYYTKKKLSCEYIHTMWNVNLFYKEYQPLNDCIQNIYNVTPQLNINFRTNTFNLLNYHLFSQITQFKNTNYKYPQTIRFHIEPTIDISSNILNIDLNNEIKLKTTHYQQKNINFYNTITHTKNLMYLKHSVNRCIPQFKSNAKIIIQKKTQTLKKYQQTIEPKIQYLYTAYRNQKNIALYDTTIFQINQNNLFENDIFSGLDRIKPTNQLTIGINTKIYNKNNTEVFNLSLGTIYSFTIQTNKTSLENNNTRYRNNKNIQILATNNYWNINNTLGINTDLQYNTQIKKLNSGNTIIEFRTNNNTILQINYHYLNSKYFANLIPETIPLIYQKNISQIGLIGNWPINNILTLSGTQFFNIKNKKNINQTIGIQYRTCCWTINTSYEKKINFQNKTNRNNTKKYNNKLSINVILHGINNTLQQQSQICDILYTNTLPYQTIL